MQDSSKVIRVTYEGTEYNIFLSEDDKIEVCIGFFKSQHVGTRIQWNDLPWPIRELVERNRREHL